MVAARKKGRMGCLLTLLILAAGSYYGVEVGQSYVRYLRMLDEMKVQARFAPNLENDVILRRLRAKVDALELPREAKRFTIRRRSRPREIVITTTWQDTLNLPFVIKIVTRTPEAKASL